MNPLPPVVEAIAVKGVREVLRFRASALFPEPWLDHTMCSFPTVGTVECVSEENIPGNSQPVAPESSSCISVTLGTRSPEDRASTKRAICRVSKKPVEQEDTKAGKKPAKPQKGPIG